MEMFVEGYRVMIEPNAERPELIDVHLKNAPITPVSICLERAAAKALAAALQEYLKPAQGK